MPELTAREKVLAKTLMDVLLIDGVISLHGATDPELIVAARDYIARKNQVPTQPIHSPTLQKRIDATMEVIPFVADDHIIILRNQLGIMQELQRKAL